MDCCVWILGCHSSSLPQVCPVQQEDFCRKSTLYPTTVSGGRWEPSSLNCTSPAGRLEQAQLLRELRTRAVYFKWKVFQPTVPSAFTLILHLNRQCLQRVDDYVFYTAIHFKNIDVMEIFSHHHKLFTMQGLLGSWSYTLSIS